MEAIFTTNSLKPSERFDYWHEVVCRTYSPCIGQVGSIDDFEATVGVFDFGAVQITDVRSSGITYDRRLLDVRTGPRDDLYAVVMLEGKTIVSQNGNEAVAEAGDIFLYNSDQPYRHKSDRSYHCISMRIPRPLLQSRIYSLEEFSGRVLKANSPYGRVVGSLIREAAQISSDSDITDKSEFSKPILEMIAAAVDRGTGNWDGAGQRGQVKLQRIKRYMRDNLGDSELSPARISQDQGVSLRTLARLFAEIETTPMAWLQGQRLACAYAAIAERNVGSVTEAAFLFGFKDLSHFGRLFKKAYGHTPNTLLDGR